MKITDIEAIHLRIPDVEEIADGTQDVLVVRVHADNGLVGVGEVPSQSYVCKAIIDAPRSAERRHGLREILVGREIDDLQEMWQTMYYHTNRYGRRGAAIHAISGADIALWDIRGQYENKPICELLGGAQRTTGGQRGDDFDERSSLLRRRDGEAGTHRRHSKAQTAGHVVAITNEGDAFAGDASPSFLESETVSQGLTRMLFVTQCVDDPELVRRLGEVHQPCLLERPNDSP